MNGFFRGTDRNGEPVVCYWHRSAGCVYIVASVAFEQTRRQTRDSPFNPSGSNGLPVSATQLVKLCMRFL